MRIATYNIWNDERGGATRQRQIADAIIASRADVIGLQEVTARLFHERLSGLYPHAAFRAYAGEDEGLAVLSGFPIREIVWLNDRPEHGNSAGLHALIEAEGARISVINLHLPWDSALEKERQIVAMDCFARGQRADVHVMLGDFNGSQNSSVHRFLTGEQSLMGSEANPCWYELSDTYAALRDEPVKPTLDFRRNPRWGGRNTTEIPIAADRIYVMRHDGMDDLRSVRLFGTEVSTESGYAASDHYGVVAEIAFQARL